MPCLPACDLFIGTSNSNSKSGINLLAIFDWVCFAINVFFFYVALELFGLGRSSFRCLWPYIRYSIRIFLWSKGYLVEAKFIFEVMPLNSILSRLGQMEVYNFTTEERVLFGDPATEGATLWPLICARIGPDIAINPPPCPVYGYNIYLR